MWNEASVIRECLADVRAQLGEWECVLALDGPSDGTAEIVREEVAGDARFCVLERPHQGLVATLNAGLAACRAPIIVRMDADDRMHPERVLRQVAALEDEGVGVVTCEVAYAALGEAQGGMQRHVVWLNGLRSSVALANARFIDAPVAHPAVAYRADVVRAIGGYRGGDFAEDHDLWLRLFAAGVVFGWTASDGPLVTWRDHAARATRCDARYHDEARRALVHRHLRDVLAGRAVRVWGAGPYGRWHARHLMDAGVEVVAFVDIDPRKIGQRHFERGVPVIAADAVGARDEVVTLVAVASRGAREIIAERLLRAGHVEGRDWWALQ